MVYSISRLLSIGILIGITCFALRITWETQQASYTVVSFQISGYELLLETKQSIQGFTTPIKNKVADLQTRLHTVLSKNGTPITTKVYTQLSDTDIEEKVVTFRMKLLRISRIIGGVVGLIVWKILFDIFFGVKQLRRRLHSYIIE